MPVDSFSTYFPTQAVDLLAQASGQQIRDFFLFLKDPEALSPYASLNNDQQLRLRCDEVYRDILNDYHAKPQKYDTDALIALGQDIAAASQHPVRIEVRDYDPQKGAAQIASRGIYGPYRRITVDQLRQTERLKNIAFDVKISGSMSFEFNVPGVNKELPLRFLASHFDAVLEKMGYTAGPHIDAKKTKTFIAADGDGTTYGQPTLTHVPLLKDSEAYDELIDYLRCGGIYVIISGNDLQRTASRIKGCLPEDVAHRFVIVANGGANMAVFQDPNNIREVQTYRESALKVLEEPNRISDLDVIYIGDDGKTDGNDFSAFASVGFDRSFVVCDKDEHLDERLNNCCIGGYVEGTKKILQQVVALAKSSSADRLFTPKHVGAWKKA